MYDANSSFELTWVSPRYPAYKPQSQGRWRVLVANDEPVGIVWTDNEAAAGVSWVTQTEEVDKVRRHFGESFEAQMTATQAYQAVERLAGIRLLDEESGVMEAVSEELFALRNE